MRDTRMITETKDYTLYTHDDRYTVTHVFMTLLGWYDKHKAYDGEKISQTDDTVIDAHIVLSEIADKIFVQEYK